MSKLIVVAGPSGCGKTQWARLLSNVFGGEVIGTDDFKDLNWDDVPEAVYEELLSVRKDFPNDAFVILEGVRALSVIFHKELIKEVEVVWWGEKDPQRPNCQGLLTRQQDLLKLLEITPRIFPDVTKNG